METKLDLRCRIGGKSWKIKFLPSKILRDDGACSKRRQVIKVHQSLSGKKLLETVIHEVLHAEHWQIDEEYVNVTAADLARILWRVGFRET